MYMLLIICYTFNVRWKRYYYVHPHYKKKGGALMPLTENQKQSRYNYAKKALKRIPLDVQKEKYEEIKAAADNAGEPVNGYIKKAIDERMERERRSPASEQPATHKNPVSEPAATSKTKPEKHYEPFTAADAAKVDLQELKANIRYQLDIALKFGENILAGLMEKARQEPSESEE